MTTRTESKSAFTPGPWQFSIAKRSDGEIIVSHVLSSGGTGGYEYAVCQLYGHDNQEANARLIASAPDGYTLALAVATAFEDTDSPLGQMARDLLTKVQST